MSTLIGIVIAMAAGFIIRMIWDSPEFMPRLISNRLLKRWKHKMLVRKKRHEWMATRAYFDNTHDNMTDRRNRAIK